MKFTVTFHNANPNTIWNRLAAKLGRTPTHAEATAEVKRILAADPPVAVVDERAEGGPKVIKRFDTIAQAEAYVGKLPEVESGRYGIDAPEEMVNPKL